MLLDHLQNVGTKAQVSAPDGTLDYGALAQLVRVVAEQLPTDRADQCLGLPSSNSLVALATLVACIEAGQSFALAPHDAGPEDFPPFCAAWLQAGGSPDTPKLGVHPIDGRTPCKVTRGQFYAASSGSTGAPKWIIHTARGLIDNTAGCAARLGLGPDHRVMIPVPIHHMFGLGPALMANLQAGSTIHLVQRGNPLDIFAGERDFDPTTTFFVPSQCRSLLAMRRQVRLYRMIVVAGDYLSPEQARTFEAKNGPIVGLYGSSELGVVAAGRPNDPVSVRDGYTGPLLPDATPCGPREDLEQEHQIFLRSTSGYLGYADPQGGIGIPAQACFDTGDLGRFDAEGRIQCLDVATGAGHLQDDGLRARCGYPSDPRLQLCLGERVVGEPIRDSEYRDLLSQRAHELMRVGAWHGELRKGLDSLASDFHEGFIYEIGRYAPALDPHAVPETSELRLEPLGR